MPLGLKRYQHEGDDHFITFSCHNRLPYLNTTIARDTFIRSLEQTRRQYAFNLLGYVIMPEHVHLLLGEPPEKPLSRALQSLKVSVSKQLMPRPFWTARYYDFNVFTRDKLVEKLHYMHQNPVVRGLAPTAEDWQWSSYRHYAKNEPALVKITNI